MSPVEHAVVDDVGVEAGQEEVGDRLAELEHQHECQGTGVRAQVGAQQTHQHGVSGVWDAVGRARMPSRNTSTTSRVVSWSAGPSGSWNDDDTIENRMRAHTSGSRRNSAVWVASTSATAAMMDSGARPALAAQLVRGVHQAAGAIEVRACRRVVGVEDRAGQPAGARLARGPAHLVRDRHHATERRAAGPHHVHDVAEHRLQVPVGVDTADRRHHGQRVQGPGDRGDHQGALVVEDPEQGPFGDAGGVGDLARGHAQAVLDEQRDGRVQDGRATVLGAEPGARAGVLARPPRGLSGSVWLAGTATTVAQRSECSLI